MDWQLVIKRNRVALAGVVAGLIAMASLPLVGRDTKAACTSVRAGRSWVGVKSPDANTPTPDPSPQGGGETGRAAAFPPPSVGFADISPSRGEIVRACKTLSRPLHRAILRILRPAEAALRRLIVVVAAVMQAKARARVQPGEARARPLPDFSTFVRHERLAAFALIDPRKSLGGLARPIGAAMPRISVPGLLDVFSPSKPDRAFDAATLMRRIRKLQYALNTLPRQARRLNRLMVRRAGAKPGPGRVGPIRPGHPPGHRHRPCHPVDDILRDCHFFARDRRLKPP